MRVRRRYSVIVEARNVRSAYDKVRSKDKSIINWEVIPSKTVLKYGLKKYRVFFWKKK